MNYIPKIVYNDGTSKNFTFDSQPEEDPYKEVLDPEVKVTRSSSGERQVQYNYQLKTYSMTFKYQSKSLFDKFRSFYEDHASKGGAFDFYISSDEITYETMQLRINSLKIERPVFASGDFEYNFSFIMEKVE